MGEAPLTQQQQIEADPEYALPEGFEERVLTKLSDATAPRKDDSQRAADAALHTYTGDKPPAPRAPFRTHRTLKIAALVVLLAVLVLGTLITSSGAVRKWMARLVTRDLGVATQIELDGRQELSYTDWGLSQDAWLPTWIPAGYHIEAFSQRPDSGLVTVEFLQPS